MTLGDLACNCHFTRFLVAEALAAFDPGEDGLPPLGAALLDACSALGHSSRKLATVAARIEALERCFPRGAPGTWIIEWVAVAEPYRRHGICGQLTYVILAEGARRGCCEAQISTYIGNDAAAAAYARSGFLAAREHRSVDLEHMLGHAPRSTIDAVVPAAGGSRYFHSRVSLSLAAASSRGCKASAE